MWEHEKLAVYQQALDVAVRLDAICRGIPEARYDLRDQIRRASASIPLNLAEGANEFKPAEKARFYRMARRSAAECASALDLLSRVCRGKAGQSRAAKRELHAVAAALTLLINTHAQRR